MFWIIVLQFGDKNTEEGNLGSVKFILLELDTTYWIFP